VDALPIQSDSDCPSSIAVQAEVRELTTPEQRAGVPPNANVTISDREDRIAIAITRDGKTTVRIYQDAARDCERRAHFVSVLVVVSLMPPDVSAGLESEAEAESESQSQTQAGTETQTGTETESKTESPAPASAQPKRVRIELGARGEVGTPISDTVRIATVGGALGVAIGAGRLRFTLATAYTPSSELRFTAETPGRAELERLDVALGLRFMLSHASLATSLDVAALASRAEVRGLTSHRPTQDTAFSIGGRAGLGFGWSEQNTLSPFLGAHVSVFPAAPALYQLPQGTVGHLPYVWLGLSGGVSLAL
jgi:hypothetical protein